MDSNKLAIFVSLFFLVPFCEGCMQGCDTNVTLNVNEGSTAEFTTKTVLFKPISYFYNTTAAVIKTIFRSYVSPLEDIEDLRRGITFESPSLERRMNISADGHGNLTIFLKDITQFDNGTYKFSHVGDLLSHDPCTCWTLFVINGPSCPLQFIPPKTAYYLTPGESLSEITCEADCNPSCSISWVKFSSGNKLNLGKVSEDTTGEYICRASLAGSATVIERRLYVYVQDTSSSTIAFSVLGTLLTLSTLVIICTLVYLCCRRPMSEKESSCIPCFKKKDASNPEPNISGVPTVEEYQMEPAHINVYEALERHGTGSENAMYSELEHENAVNINTEIVNVSSMH